MNQLRSGPFIGHCATGSEPSVDLSTASQRQRQSLSQSGTGEDKGTASNGKTVRFFFSRTALKMATKACCEHQSQSTHWSPWTSERDLTLGGKGAVRRYHEMCLTRFHSAFAAKEKNVPLPEKQRAIGAYVYFQATPHHTTPPLRLPIRPWDGQDSVTLDTDL